VIAYRKGSMTTRFATTTLSSTEDTEDAVGRSGFSFVSFVSFVVNGALAVALSASVAAAQAPSAPATERPAVGPARPFQLAPRVERTLTNGLRVIVTQQSVVPKVSVTLTIRSGYSSDPADLTGLASLTGDLIQEGTRTRSSQQIRRQMFGMGGSLTASASQDFTAVSARGLSEFTAGLIDLVADVAVNPTFPQEEFAILVQQHLQSVEQQQASPQFLANREFRKQLFGQHPYARTSETADSIKAMDRAKVVAFHRDHYRPNNAFLLVVGDVQPAQVFAAAQKAFGGWARGAVPQPAFAAPPALSGRHVYFVQRPNSIQSSIAVGNFAVKRSDPRWFEMMLANTIYGGAFNSRIVKNIREEKGYTYSPSSAFTGFANAGFYKFAADVRNEVTGATLTEVYKEIDTMRAGGSDGAELAGAKSYMRGVFALQTATQGGLSATLNNVYVFDLPKNYPETFRSTIAELTPARVKAGADALLGSADSVVVIVGDWAKVKDQLGAFTDITFLDINGRTIAPPAP
jgi:zinc protease